MNFQKVISDIFLQVSRQKSYGEVAGYIPELALVDAEKFGVCMATVDGKYYHAGDWLDLFSIQSIVKVLLLSMAYKKLGGRLWQRVGVEPSGTRFNSMGTLENDEGIPRNPFSNAGALVICDVLLDLYDQPQQAMLEMIRQITGDSSVEINNKIAASEQNEGYRNVAMVNFIKSLGNINNDVNKVLDLYFNCCSISINCMQLTQLFMLFANNGKTLDGSYELLNPSQTKRMNAIMLTCGFYDEAGDFAYKVGLPGKSGVGGGIVAVLPKHFSVAVWSPRLNEKGNSYRGLKFLEKFTTDTQLSIF